MKFVLLSIAVLAMAGQSSSGDVMLIWSQEQKACGIHNYRPSYNIEVIAGSDPAEISGRRAEISAAARAAGPGWLWNELVPRDRCVAVAYMQRTIGSCSFRTYTWEIGEDETLLVARLQSRVRSTTGVTASGLEEVRCRGAVLPPRRDTAWAIRG
jgi:hypothetical protein